jgi:tetratricopeptide (TPR) repeat protein
MRRFLFPVALCLCLQAVISQHNTVAAKDTWVSVRTKNFFLVGNASEKDIRRIGIKLEQYREVFTRFFPKINFKTPVPTTVMVFKNAGSYAPFKIRERSSGHFQSGIDVNYIALTSEANREDFSVIFHEFTHLLVNNNFKNAPVWFNEGLAEYYSTFHMSEDQKVVLGFPIVNHVLLLRRKKLLPLRTLFAVDHKSPDYNETEKTSIFYAQSWALMHYLMIGKPGSDQGPDRFTELLNSKVPFERAFEEAFKTTLDAMETELRNYVAQDKYKVRLANFANTLELNTTTEATKLSEAEALAYQGDLLAHSNRKEAYAYLEQAVKLDPNLAMAHASLGMAYFRDGKKSAAQESLARAVAANSQNYLAHYYYAFVLSRADDQAPSITSYSAELAAKIREHLQKAMALRPDFPEPYNLLAYVSLVTSTNIDEAIVTLKRVLSEMPDQHNLKYMLGQLYAHKDDFKNARELLEQVIKSNADEEVRRLSASLLKQVNTSEEQRARYEAAKQTSAIVVDADGQTGKNVPFDPSQQLREALRSPAAGETRLQASLVKIECEAKGGIVFVVKTASGLLRLRTANFNNIEIKTWDAAVSGEITCGDRKPENGVVVCYLPNPDKRLKIDGILKSIEFVPSDFKLKP